MATLEDAVCNVRQLETINLPDEQPQIEAPPASVTYISNFDTNFEDSKAFITCVSKYLEEADVHKGLVGVTYFQTKSENDGNMSDMRTFGQRHKSNKSC